eukprot:GHVT01087454.1.p1 GENE.GHVT01087454.1~~GHVT01087454.1.p1  ORF type:complete len:328 (-),score=40.16 GHVT01087454.1:553-1536(-)
MGLFLQRPVVSHVFLALNLLAALTILRYSLSAMADRGTDSDLKPASFGPVIRDRSAAVPAVRPSGSRAPAAPGLTTSRKDDPLMNHELYSATKDFVYAPVCVIQQDTDGKIVEHEYKNESQARMFRWNAEDWRAGTCDVVSGRVAAPTGPPAGEDGLPFHTAAREDRPLEDPPQRPITRDYRPLCVFNLVQPNKPGSQASPVVYEYPNKSMALMYGWEEKDWVQGSGRDLENGIQQEESVASDSATQQRLRPAVRKAKSENEKPFHTTTRTDVPLVNPPPTMTTCEYAPVWVHQLLPDGSVKVHKYSNRGTAFVFGWTEEELAHDRS